jgi:hypothetical protein
MNKAFNLSEELSRLEIEIKTGNATLKNHIIYQLLSAGLDKNLAEPIENLLHNPFVDINTLISMFLPPPKWGRNGRVK